MLQRRFSKTLYFVTPCITNNVLGDTDITYEGEKICALASVTHKKVRTFPKSAHRQFERFGTYERYVLKVYMPKNTRVLLGDGVFFHPLSIHPNGHVKSLFYHPKYIMAEIEVMQ